MRYPVYIPSRGRSALCRRELTSTFARCREDGVPFNVVVVPSEADEYRDALGLDGDSDGVATVLVLPDDGYVLKDARNWIRAHAEAAGHARHWQLDDNIKEFRRLYRGRRIPCSVDLALGACEDFSDRYTNVAVSGLNYQMFVPAVTPDPFFLNVHVYSCTLINHEWPGRWRLVYNDDTDLCLQALADGWTTVLLNVFMANKERTMKVRGGNTDQLYQGDGRLRMAQALAQAWPGVVRVDRRFGRPQHVIDWRKFDTPLIRRDDYAERVAATTDGGTLKAVREVRSDALRRLAGDES